MKGETIDRKEFMARIGKLGAGACMCAAAAAPLRADRREPASP
jgi:hypothetical protein